MPARLGRPVAASHSDAHRNMAHIRYTPPDEAGPGLARLYRRYADGEGNLDNILRVHSLNPPSLKHHHDLYRHLMAGPSPLSGLQREMIAVVVSAENDCFY